jgi:hypothetical protein
MSLLRISGHFVLCDHANRHSRAANAGLAAHQFVLRVNRGNSII